MLKLALRGAEFTPEKAVQEKPLALAFVGDSVFDLYVREYVRASGLNTHMLHREAVKFVSAHAQAEAFIAIEAQLTPQEEYIYRRGRNTKPTTVPKNAGVKDYRSATGLETLVGYLFLTGQLERLDELMERILTGTRQDDGECEGKTEAKACAQQQTETQG